MLSHVNYLIHHKEKEEAEEKLRCLQLLEEEEEQKKLKKMRDEFEKEKNWRLAQGREMLKSAEITLSDPAELTDIKFESDLERRSNTSSRLPSAPSIVSSAKSLYSDLDIPTIDK